MEAAGATTVILSDIGAFQCLLKKTKCDKAALWAGWPKLKSYIDINVAAGLFGKKCGNAITGIAASSPGDWRSSAVFRDPELSELAREGTARVIEDLKADALCMIVAAGNEALRAFNSDLLNRRYSEHLLVDSSNDPSGIDVGHYARGGRNGPIRMHSERNHSKRSETIFRRCCRPSRHWAANSASMFISPPLRRDQSLTLRTQRRTTEWTAWPPDSRAASEANCQVATAMPADARLACYRERAAVRPSTPGDCPGGYEDPITLSANR